MSREDVRARFARNAANYVTSAFHADSALLDEVVALAVPQPTDVVLDVATGPGTVARQAAVLVGPAGRVTGVDISPAMLGVARAWPGDWNKSIRASGSTLLMEYFGQVQTSQTAGSYLLDYRYIINCARDAVHSGAA